jgi:uncharacterized ion transporter superfamily protein YfcC
MNEADPKRQAAYKRAKAKKDFRNHVAVYVIVNALLIVIWAVSGQGYFWPMWPLLGWGIGLVLNGWTAYYERPVSEDDIRREMERGE